MKPFPKKSAQPEDLAAVDSLMSEGMESEEPEKETGGDPEQLLSDVETKLARLREMVC